MFELGKVTRPVIHTISLGEWRLLAGPHTYPNQRVSQQELDRTHHAWCTAKDCWDTGPDILSRTYLLRRR